MRIRCIRNEPDSIPAFNALRMTDLLGSYNPRYVELDVFGR